ncbi:MAG: hypothetical protein CVU56_14480 [Deltaproteobacteria bacterium HGW-Deltaproteobacteria-14]|nr:MAG: hypothetical protein CVU56_14480 [Deltaproteobacteria bacterium HGW-Deltaproteobacteria-14]
MFDTWRHKRTEPPEPNLIPVMNLMMTLIPFLLLGASFFHLAVIPTSTSQLTAHDSDVPKTPRQVSVSLVINADGFNVTAASTSLDPEELATMATVIPRPAGGAYDIAALQRHLAGIKHAYPASNTILVFPNDDLDYQQLVDILDATREEIIRGDNGAKTRRPLFPVSVFNRLVPPPPEPEPEPAEGADLELDGGTVAPDGAEAPAGEGESAGDAAAPLEGGTP